MRRLIRTDGTTADHDQPKDINAVRELIGANVLDTVILRHLGQPLHVMIVNDLGHRHGLPVNAEATRLYLANCVPGTTHEIRGDVFVAPDEDFK